MSVSTKSMQHQQQQHRNKQLFQNSSYNNSNMANYNGSTSRIDGGENEPKSIIIDKKDLFEINNRLNLYVNTVRTNVCF